MSFARKIKRARGMARRWERKRIQKDLAKRARARDAAKQTARAGTRIPKLEAKIIDGKIVIDVNDDTARSSAAVTQ